MNFDTQWDVDKYKTDFESDEHWQLRRSFMMAHKDSYPEERLVCLAQVFTNVEFLGCRYPTETMQLVAHLSQGVADEHREKQKTKLQRTFVEASDAAGAKVKGLKRPHDSEPASRQESNKSRKGLETPPSKAPDVHQPVATSSSISERTISNGTGTCTVTAASRYGGVRTYHIDRMRKTRATTGDLIGNSPYGKLVLIERLEDHDSPKQIIQKSTSACHVPSNYVYEHLPTGKVCCKLYVSGRLVSSGIDFSNKSAREAAAASGLLRLRETCYTLKVKAKFLSNGTIDKSLSRNGKDGQGSGTPLADDNNIGNKLMRLMGWSGGGLGKDQQGIQEPVTVSQQVDRAGLGIVKSRHSKSFESKIRQLLQDYARTDSHHDLVFSTDFSKEERKKMHQIATNFNLKTRSYGRGALRHLIVSRKVNIVQIVEQMIHNVGVSHEKYELVRPTQLDL